MSVIIVITSNAIHASNKLEIKEFELLASALVGLKVGWKGDCRCC